MAAGIAGTAISEEQWLRADDLHSMLRYLNGSVSERKYRLTECAFVRRFWHLLTDPRSRRAVEVAEQFADGLVSKDELKAAYAEAEHAFEEVLTAHFPTHEVMRSFWGGGVSAAQHAASSAHDLPELFGKQPPERYRTLSSLVWIATAAYPIGTEAGGQDGYDAIRREHGAEAVLLHDLFGNPFRPVSPDGSWITPAVVRLARTIYYERRFDRMHELAEALERAGCANAEILDHCGRPRLHVRGCWVVDLLLGKL